MTTLGEWGSMADRAELDAYLSPERARPRVDRAQRARDVALAAGVAVRRRARLVALRVAYLATAVSGTVLGVSGMVLWSVASALEDAAQPDLGG